MSNKKDQNDKLFDKISLANLLNMDEVAAEDEARAKKQKANQEEN